MALIEGLQQQLSDIRRHIHRHPELSGEEIQTTAYIRQLLEAADIQILSFPNLKTGVIAEIGTGESVIALRADIDALPVQEETGLAFASEVNGKMHACGHDFHTASLLGAAYLLKEQEHQLQGRVRLIFQPAEEKAKGAQQVIANGALEGVQAIFGLHNKPDLPVGTVGIRNGALMAAADGFIVEVTGVGTHAAVPEAGIDPIVVSAHIVTAIQSIVSRNISSQQGAVISVTQLNSGHVWNVIPDLAVLQGTIRTFDEQVRKQVLSRFEQIVEGVATAFGTSAKVKWLAGPPPVLNDEQWTGAAQIAAEKSDLQVVEPAVSPASEDFSFYQKEVPGVFIFVGTSGPQEWHHPSFDVDERALSSTATFLANTARVALKQVEQQPISSTSTY
ncbi:amidohydrolase [Paenibacillus sp. SORGH_AS306]|uniref:amidohydrolase n=1 Tax=unclassified Paenibacillus TaxID=185978 RepID=UPI00277EE854|nr:MULTISPECIES: amidohydrolase [unclassified Paenibacillus]MDQ1234031.1 amidohydrolase [Paenibacillus sp. SORGH_AS_0306]MDR6111075.1 amidohydrolase [Paenibacillus sp. SORGH_AS_0338]